jgi:hypothetical protein
MVKKLCIGNKTDRENTGHTDKMTGESKIGCAYASKGVFGTAEWAKYNENIMAGCEHDCLYCYAKEMAVRFGRVKADEWKSPVLDTKKVSRKFSLREGVTMFPTTHDITPAFLPETIDFIDRMLKPGNKVLLVSKPHLACIEEICSHFAWARSQLLFRFTMGSASDAVLAFWEPGAPAFSERLASLRHAHAEGFATSVSCEPMLDDRPDRVVEVVSPYVTDSVWLGKANMLKNRMAVNGHRTDEEIAFADRLLAAQSDDSIRALYERLKDNPKVKWKESIKRVVGLEISTEKGLDI